MNTELVKQEIGNILSTVSQPSRKQYPVAKHQMKSLEELGILELMPKNFGYTDAAVVIEAAQDSGKQTGGFTEYGDADVVSHSASKLYQLLNEPEAAEQTAQMESDVKLTTSQKTELALLYREIEILDGDLKRAKRKYPKGEPYGILDDIYHGLIMKRDEIAVIYESVNKPS